MRGAIHTIVLHGHLRQFGSTFQFACLHAADAARALAVQLPGFREAFEQGSYHVVRRQKGTGARHLGEEDLTLHLGEVCSLHFVPAVSGAKNGGVGKAIIGAVIMIAAVVAAPYTGGSSVAAGLSTFSFGWGGATAFAIGMSMAISGVAQMLSPSSKIGKSGNGADERRSFSLRGQLDPSMQGLPVPVIYGRYMVPLTIISAGIAPEAA